MSALISLSFFFSFFFCDYLNPQEEKREEDENRGGGVQRGRNRKISEHIIISIL